MFKKHSIFTIKKNSSLIEVNHFPLLFFSAQIYISHHINVHWQIYT